MKTLAVLTSGGDSPGMNAAIRAVVKVASAKGFRVLGAEEGFEGLIDGRFRELTRSASGARCVPTPEVDAMGSMGGTVLGSARSARFRDRGGRAEAIRHLTGIDGLIVIGGNGSLAGAHALSAECAPTQVIGIPASIDNDIGCTSTAIGVDTALNTIVQSCDRISDTARAHRRAFVVEVMGRQCGYLAMASAVAAGADAVLFREQGREQEQLIDALGDLIRGALSQRDKRRVLVIKAEGVEIPCLELVRRLEKRLGPSMPEVEIRGTVLGHLVRGGSPSYQDRMVAGRLAFAAVQAMADGATDEMVAWNPVTPGGKQTGDPAVFRFPLTEVLAETARLIDGTSPITRRRVQMMEMVEGVLPL
ncbi:MAG TPA: 6-phosphofructokinase [Myxococcaceae bacterium]|nr:6-phosphofructokinase [Myxococcaceae bacterium]